jgi:hypothetical protein
MEVRALKCVKSCVLPVVERARLEAAPEKLPPGPLTARA